MPNIIYFEFTGLQTHQTTTKGYGFYTSDEGHRLLTQLRNKETKGHGEVALLCKMWGGKGDCSNLASGQLI